MEPEIYKHYTEVRGNRKSALCLNPNPQHRRDGGYKKLPGALGELAKRAQGRDIYRHPNFMHALKLLNRRKFHPLRENLINAFCRAVIDCLDLATCMTTKTLEAIANGLNVTPCRVTRLIKEIMLPGGFMYVHGGDDNDPNFGHCFDSTHGMYFPKLLVITDKFFEVCGADSRLLERLHNQADEKLAAHICEDTAQQMTVIQARDARRKWAWDRSYLLRKDHATAQRKRAFIERLGSKDKRIEHVAKQLLLKHPFRYMAAEPSLLVRDAENVLIRMQLNQRERPQVPLH